MIVPEPADDTVPVPPAGEEVAVYVVIVSPPLEAGCVKATVAVVDPVAVAVPIVGAPGTVRGVTEDDAVEKLPLPAALMARTWKMYGVPLAKPVTVTDVAVDAARVNVTQFAPLSKED